MGDFITEAFMRDRVPKLMKGEKEIKVRDSKLTGFMLRVRRNADDTFQRDFFINYLDPATKKRRFMKVGDYPTFGCDEAREAARLHLQDHKSGNDPKAIRAAKRAQATFDDLWKDFQRDHVDLKEPGTQKDYRGRVRRVLEPAFKGRRVADITRAEVQALRRKFRDKPTELNRAYAVGSKMMSYAIAAGMRSDNPFKGAERFREQANDTWIDEKNIGPFVEALGKVEGAVGDLLRFVACTGWRISAARLLRWDQVNLDRLEVHLDDKATKIHATALSTDAATIIDMQPHRIGYVFSGRGAGGMPVGYKLILATLTATCDAAGIDRITPHTLRRTLATHSAIHGASISELMAAYGWRSVAMAARYVKRSETLARQGTARAASIMNVLGRPAAEVLPMTARHAGE